MFIKSYLEEKNLIFSWLVISSVKSCKYFIEVQIKKYYESNSVETFNLFMVQTQVL